MGINLYYILNKYYTLCFHKLQEYKKNVDAFKQTKLATAN